MAWRLPAGLTNSAGARRSSCRRGVVAEQLLRAPLASAAGATSPSRRLPASSGASHSSTRSIERCRRRAAGSPHRSGARRRRDARSCERALIPRQQGEPMLANAVEQRLLDRCLVGRGIGPAREPDRAEAPAARRSDRSGRRIEIAVVAGLDPVAEEVEHGVLVDRARRRGSARPTRGPRLRRPRAMAARQAAKRDRAGSRGRRPTASSRRSVAPARDAVGESERERLAPGHAPRRSAAACDSDATPARRHLSRRLGARGLVGAPAPPARLEVRIVAAEAALGQQHGDVGRGSSEAALSRIDQHVREARLERQRGDRAAMVGDAPVGVDRAERRPACLRASSSAARGGGSRKGRRRGSASPQSRQVSSRLDKVGFEDLRRVVRRKRGGRGFFPQADRNARAPGARRGPRAA